MSLYFLSYSIKIYNAPTKVQKEYIALVLMSSLITRVC